VSPRDSRTTTRTRPRLPASGLTSSLGTNPGWSPDRCQRLQS
jgi:hypothetical protein